MTHAAEPALRDRDTIPKGLVRGMVALVAAALAITVFAVATGREPSARPLHGAGLAEREVRLIAGAAQSVTVTDAAGTVLLELPHGGFITVVQGGLAFTRHRHGVAADLPVRLVRYPGRRLALIDPETGWSVELHAFGADNRAAFDRLLGG